MTKEECVEIVDRVLAHWNQLANTGAPKATYNAWWRIIGELDATECHTVIDVIAREDTYMPRAGTVYRRVIDMHTESLAPTPHEAWAIYRDLASQLDSGNYTPTNLHPVLQQTIKTVGGYSLHTNSDREHFIQIYTKQWNETYQQ